MKRLILLHTLLCSLSLFSQVGIGTTSPKFSLDIVASNTTAPTATDGILIPRIDALSATNPSADQQAMLIY